jgi:hypothetical protein
MRFEQSARLWLRGLSFFASPRSRLKASMLVRRRPVAAVDLRCALPDPGLKPLILRSLGLKRTGLPARIGIFCSNLRAGFRGTGCSVQRPATWLLDSGPAILGMFLGMYLSGPATQPRRMRVSIGRLMPIPAQRLPATWEPGSMITGGCLSRSRSECCATTPAFIGFPPPTSSG